MTHRPGWDQRLCRKHLHKMTPENVRNGGCRACVEKYDAERYHRLHPRDRKWKWCRKHLHRRTPANTRKGFGGCRLCYNASISEWWHRTHHTIPKRGLKPKPVPKRDRTFRDEQRKWEYILTKAGLGMGRGIRWWLVYGHEYFDSIKKESVTMENQNDF